MSIKLAAPINFIFHPTPKSLFLEIMQNIRGNCVAVHGDRFTNLHIGFLEKYNLHCFIVFCAHSNSISSDMFIE